ncbi:hypothetical protein KIPB_002122, partial [Kipferlia bialata]
VLPSGKAVFTLPQHVMQHTRLQASDDMGRIKMPAKKGTGAKHAFLDLAVQAESSAPAPVSVSSSHAPLALLGMSLTAAEGNTSVPIPPLPIETEGEGEGEGESNVTVERSVVRPVMKGMQAPVSTSLSLEDDTPRNVFNALSHAVEPTLTGISGFVPIDGNEGAEGERESGTHMRVTWRGAQRVGQGEGPLFIASGFGVAGIVRSVHAAVESAL